MIASEQTYQQIERALRKAASKFSPEAECLPLTDLILQVKQESGELRIYDDDNNELTRCVIEEWIDNQDENFYDEIRPILVESIKRIKPVTENVAILKPYSYVLSNDEDELLGDLYLVDDDRIILSGDLMEGLDDDLNHFWEEVAREDK